MKRSRLLRAAALIIYNSLAFIQLSATMPVFAPKPFSAADHIKENIF